MLIPFKEDIEIAQPRPEHADNSHKFETLFCAHCGTEHRVPVYCGDRFCPVCSGPRRRRMIKKIKLLVDAVHYKPGATLKFLTLTIKNHNDPAVAVSHLIRAFKRFRQTKFWKEHAIGGLYVIEVTSNGEQWHAHIHALVHSYFMPVFQISTIWEKCSGGKIVWIQNLYTKNVAEYIAKYVSKSAVPIEQRPILSKALGSLRLFQTFGNWHDIKIPDVKLEYPCANCGCTEWIPSRVVERIARTG